jgi:myo-inositol-1(or 4)-monophosphatase
VSAPRMSDDAAVAVEAALAGGRVLQARGRIEAKAKEDRTSIVTEADLGSQAEILRTIRAARPDDAVVGEEGTDGDPDAERVWVVDPLDGTTNYAHGFPFCCVSVALRERGVVVAGAVYAPVFAELFSARRGGGAVLGGERIQVSRTASLDQALVATGLQTSDPARIAAHAERVSRLHGSARGVRMPGSPALSLCHVACGRLDAFLEEGLKPWDTAAGVLILAEAGGRSTSFRPDGDALAASGEVLATNGRVHDELLELLGD